MHLEYEVRINAADIVKGSWIVGVEESAIDTAFVIRTESAHSTS